MDSQESCGATTARLVLDAAVVPWRSKKPLELQRRLPLLCRAKTDGNLALACRLLAEITTHDVVFGHISSSSTAPAPAPAAAAAAGLLRSKSVPLEGSQSREFILHIESNSSASCSAAGVKARCVAVLDHEAQQDAPKGLARASAQSKIRDAAAAAAAAASSSSCTASHESKIRDAAASSSSRTASHESKIREAAAAAAASSSSRTPSGLPPEISSAGATISNLSSRAVAADLVVPSDVSPGDLPTGKASTPTAAIEEASPTASDSSNKASEARCLRATKCPPSGKLLVCGRRRHMEDTAAIVPSFAVLPGAWLGGCSCDKEPETRTSSDLHFFAVYDGHGGSQASKFCVQRLHKALADEIRLSGENAGSNWEKVLTECFYRIDREVGGVCPNGECDNVDSTSTCCGNAIAPENVGTTATVAVISSCQIIVANCGDSRAILSRSGKTIPLSKDHKPERDDETSRIEAAGGRVIFWDGYRVGGLLALSRAIGDRYLKRYVVSEPEVTCLQRTEEDECLILASDGLWDVLSNDFACKVARKCLASAGRRPVSGDASPREDQASASAAALLVKLAYGRGSKDNISVVVVDLRARHI